MRRKTQRAAAAALLGLMIFLQGGCEVNKETVCERMLAYMSGRYEDTFYCPVQYGGYAGGPVRLYYMSSEKLGDAVVKVEVRDRGKPSERYLDDYMGVVYGEKLEKTIKERLAACLEVLKEDVVVLMMPSSRGVSDHWTPQTTFEEYCADPAAGICFRAVIRSGEDLEDPGVRKTAERRLEDELSAARLCCTGWLYFVPEGTDLEGLDGTTFYDKIMKLHGYSARLFFNMRSAEGVDEFTWESAGSVPELHGTGPEAAESEDPLTAAVNDD